MPQTNFRFYDAILRFDIDCLYLIYVLADRYFAISIYAQSKDYGRAMT